METLPKPGWLTVKSVSECGISRVRNALAQYKLNTVCEAALCPNIFECWHEREVTLMILGNTCTRACRFCATSSGDPGGGNNLGEARRVAEFVTNMALDYLVITSVTRDDLEDEGAGVFAQVISEVKTVRNNTKIEVLIPDFQGSGDALKAVLAAGPDVLGHNLETVERLSGQVRDARSGYRKSLRVLETAKSLAPQVLVKSSLMLGMGESEEEITLSLSDLRGAGVDIVTLGQYLSSSERNWPVARYITPGEFARWERKGCEMGFKALLAGPLVRSSYKASRLTRTALRDDLVVKETRNDARS